MLKRDELKGPSCLTNASDDEPIFVLKSTDELASAIVREWAQRYREQKGDFENMTQKQKAKYFEALHLSTQMDEWRNARQQQNTGE
jgi:hypothetical protein